MRTRSRGSAALLSQRISTSVINARMIELAKRLPPRMTVEDGACSKVMTQVGPAFASLRQAVTASDAGRRRTRPC